MFLTPFRRKVISSEKEPEGCGTEGKPAKEKRPKHKGFERMGNRRLQQRPSWQRSLKRCSKIAANRQTGFVCPTLYPPNLSFFLIWLFENGTSQTQNRLKTCFCLTKKSLLPL